MQTEFKVCDQRHDKVPKIIIYRL